MSIKVRNMISPRSGNPVANQFVITINGVETFQSYETTIAVRQADGRIVLDVNAFDYSRTTSKYLREFLWGVNKATALENVANDTWSEMDLNP